MTPRLRVRQALCTTLLVVGAARAAADDPGPAPGLDAEAAELARFEQALDQAIAGSGPYSPELAETYGGFGHYLQQRGRHAEALAMLRKAQHLERVNHGVHGAGQIPVLRAMIASYKATGQIEAASSAYDQLLWLAAKGLEPRDPQRLALLREAARWHLSAHLLDADEQRLAHLQAAHQLLGEAGTLADELGADSATRAELLRDSALGRFFLLRHQSAHRFDPALPAGYRPAPGAAVAAMPGLSTSFTAGRELYEAALAELDADPEAAPAQRRRARIELGDWYLLFDHGDEALAHYRAALAAMPASAGDEPFATPLPLPAARGSAASALVAKVRLDVSERGRPDNIELLDDGTFAAEQRLRILRAIRDARFRPAFSGGEPVASRGALIAFPLAD
ncbi:MAG: tetratricopeptide repeat protein [Pseudomonadales bacterium]|nr:tetratricopeptide repeat protein [Pseudomonadales bacterium]